ncbi:hypothetical protein CDL15_Pgr009901 [Punica granatum]|uniref:Uncharacterized protein n=1 Tax=Punica granatum TaxID=22663 RepID=A0A218WU07_PUNGR|nr:hypothetical protein CDL15_Pgr009901 [Punica granatum]
MSPKNWGEIPFNRVPSVAMKLYVSKFFKHYNERFRECLENVKLGKGKSQPGFSYPRDNPVVGRLDHRDGREVAELHWKRMVENLLKAGKLENCIAACDVYGSMRGTPMEVSVALSILVAKNWNLSSDQIVKRIFVFSDMEFEEASMNPWETYYQVIRRKFEEAGCGDSIPQIVFWNLRDSQSTPVTATQDGVALVSEFSENLVSMFLDNDGEINPEKIMLDAISGEQYQKLVVVD